MRPEFGTHQRNRNRAMRGIDANEQTQTRPKRYTPACRREARIILCSRTTRIGHPDTTMNPPLPSRTLILMRHARAIAGGPLLEDHDRPLHPKGTSDATRVAERLRARGLAPDRILTSTARRAMETAARVRDVFALPASQLESDRRIYHADAYELLALIQECGDAAKTIMVVGHNPTLSHMGSLLVGRTVHMETADLLVITHPAASWPRLALDGRATIRFHASPET